MPADSLSKYKMPRIHCPAEALVTHLESFPAEDGPAILGIPLNAGNAITEKEGLEHLTYISKFQFESMNDVKETSSSITFDPTDAMKLSRYKKKLRDVCGQVP